ncbi:MAG: arginase family protein, partial [Methyloligellaceae bacterium]
MLSNRDKRHIAILGVPVEEGAGRQGCRMGPDALRIAGLVEVLQELDHDVEDYGDVSRCPSSLQLAGNAVHSDHVSGWARSIFKAGLQAFGRERIPIFLGGDHSLSMGSVAAALGHAEQLGRPLHVLWLDAHADFNTPFTSDTGNMHGMSTALLCGESGFDGVMEYFPTLPPRQLHIFGARSIDLPEKDRLAERSVDVCDMRRLDE